MLDRVLAIADEVSASPKERKAAVETGIVESNLSNPSGGDADSAGWRQERRSLYPNPTNIEAAARRFFAEARAANRPGISAGELAARVQRPAAAYRGRYAAVSGQAEGLLGADGSGAQNAAGMPPAAQRVELGHRTSFDRAGFEQAQRRTLLAGLIARRRGPGSILLKSGVLSTTAPSKADFTKTRPTSRIVGSGSTATGGGGLPKGHSPLFELFWQGAHGINVKNGEAVPQGFVSGHTDHVHVAAGPNTVVALGKIAQRMGLRVGENPRFGGVAPVHVKGSYHYKNEAIDVSGDPGEMAVFAHKVARKFGVR